MTRPIRTLIPHRPDVRIGFVPLLSSAPIIVAKELGYFSDERLSVSLERQIGWGNIRDKLVYGHLQASVALVGMPPASVLGRDRFPEPVWSVMSVSTGGNAITVSRRLADSGVTSAATLGEWIRRRKGEAAPNFAHVFSCSMHHYLLREWLASGGVDPDRDVRLGVLPPPQMTGQLANGYLDGFCVGDPYNTAAEQCGAGRVLLATTDLVPNHPEKILAVNRGWLTRHGEVAVAVVRAVLRAGAFCHDPAHAGRLAEILARPAYLDLPASLLADCLARREKSAMSSGRHAPKATAPGFDPADMFPSATHTAWIVREMIRWSHLPADTDILTTARRSVQADVFRKAAEGAGITSPDHDFPPMRLRTGWFDAQESVAPSPGPTSTTGTFTPALR